jgi:hypothetical protein
MSLVSGISLRSSFVVGLFLSLIVLLSFDIAPSPSLRATSPAVALQTSTQQFVTLLPRLPSSIPSPWLIYPTSSTIWVVGVATPPRSQLREFFLNGTSKGIFNLTNVIVTSILADPANPSSKIWFTENSTLESYDMSAPSINGTKAITFPGESLQYLANDTRGRIWMSMIDTSGKSSIAMYDPMGPSNQTYRLPNSDAFIQGITIVGNTIWFAEAGAKKIGRLIPESSNFTEYSPPPYVNLAAPIQVAVDPSGGVWFTDHGSNQFGFFDPHTSNWKVFPIGYCPDNCSVYGLPNAIYADAKGTIWFSEHVAGRVAHYDPSAGILTEYSVPGNSPPLIWWAMPGPNNLVWFVAWALGEIGYVNASIPIPFSLSSLSSSDLVVQTGSSVTVQAQARLQGAGTLSFGVSPVTQDESIQFPSQVYGSPPSDLTLGDGSQTVGFSVSAAWNATPGPRYMALTASDGLVAVNFHVKVVVIAASAPFVAFGFSSVIVLGFFRFYLRRLRKLMTEVVGKIRRSW